MWVLDVKTSSTMADIEISAVDENNAHGMSSWGWYDPDNKIVVLRVSSLYQKYPIHNSVIDAVISVANSICEQKK